MEQIILDIIDQYGYIGVSLLIAVENIFPPIPSEVILAFSGYMTNYSTMNLWVVVLAATIGSVIGAMVLYSIGRLLTPIRLEKFISGKFARFLRLKREDITKADKWFQKFGNKTVFFCRFIPIIRSLISIPAGIARMDYRLFLILTTIGTLIWNITLITAGSLSGMAWDSVSKYYDIYSRYTDFGLVLIVVMIAAIFIKNRFFKKS